MTATDTLTCENSTDVDGEQIYCEAPATEQIKGEQDSFGIEWLHFCVPCAREVRAEIADEARSQRVGVCQWCKQDATDRITYSSSWDQAWETSLVCGKCRAKELAELRDELDEYYAVDDDDTDAVDDDDDTDRW